VAVLINIAQQSYAPRRIGASPNVPASVKALKLTATRVSWPAGPVGRISVWYPNGTFAASCDFEGGTALNKDGSTATVSGFILYGPNGGDLPGGQFTVVIDIFQTVTTALRVESI
jgi:hypothetical protein